jgi:Domain of unknown function (DUF4193)
MLLRRPGLSRAVAYTPAAPGVRCDDPVALRGAEVSTQNMSEETELDPEEPELDAPEDEVVDLEDVDEEVLEDEIEDVADVDDVEDVEDVEDDEYEEEESDDEEEDETEALDELEAEELELLDEEVSESLLVDEVAELRAIRREELTMNVEAQAVRGDEFVCRSCFLVKRASQLADRKKILCVDCA